MTQLKKNGFTFKRFFIAHDKSPMKVTTDSCLLGAWSPITTETKTVLDIGCGCGIIGLMLAQRLTKQDSHIDAVDIDARAIMQCQDNIAQSPFDNITAQRIDINHYASTCQSYYDLIVTNPPYFQSAVECRNQQRQIARYTETLDHVQLVNVVKRLLKPSGKFCLVLPYHLGAAFIAICRHNGLYLTQQLNINYNQDKAYSLTLLCFTFTVHHTVVSQSLCMRDNENRYTEDFRHLLKDFYLFNK